jgi:hypothetical protein
MYSPQNETLRGRIRTSSASQSRTVPPVQIFLSGPAVRKILDFLSPQKPTLSLLRETDTHHLRPTLRPWIAVINQILKDDADVPRRYRTTAMEILKTLREEHGFTGGYTVVQEYVQRTRGETRRQSTNRRSQNVHRKSPNTQLGVQESPIALQAEIPATEPVPSPGLLRLSLHPRKPGSSEEQVFDWMHNILQGQVSLEFLAMELKELSEEELKVLFAAATKGQRPTCQISLSMTETT